MSAVVTPKLRPLLPPAGSVGYEAPSGPALEPNAWFLPVSAEFSFATIFGGARVKASQACRNHSYREHAAVAWHGWPAPAKASLGMWDSAEWVDGSSACGWAGGALSIVQLSLLITTLTDQCWRQQEPKWHFSTLITYVSFLPPLFSASTRLQRLLRVSLDSFGLTDEKQTWC